MKYTSVFPVSWSKAVYASLGRNRPLSTPSFALSVCGAHQMSMILVFHMAAFCASLSSGVLSRPMSWLQLKQLIRMQQMIATPRRENSVALRTVFFSFSFISSSFFFLIRKYALKMNVDDRGSFTELVHTEDCGQVSINIS